MKRPFKQYFCREMVRPIIHMSFVRLVLGATVALLIAEYVKRDASFPVRGSAFLFLAALLLGMGWLAYLRLTGMKLPVPDRRLFEWRRKHRRRLGDIADYLDDEPPAPDPLEDDERDFCRLAADLLCGAAFALLSLL